MKDWQKSSSATSTKTAASMSPPTSPADVDFLFEEDSEDFEEEDEDFDDEDMLNVYFADDDTDGIHIPRTIRFPKNRD